MIKDRQFETEEAREKERRYILSVNPINPGSAFYNNRHCFARYCEMQLKSFMQWDDGSFSWYYKDIQDAIDAARGQK